MRTAGMREGGCAAERVSSSSIRGEGLVVKSLRWCVDWVSDTD